MENPKVIFVTGATGNQGSAVVRHLVSNGFRVKALVREQSVGKAKWLQRENISVVKGDLNAPAAWKDQLADVDGVFCLLTYSHGVDKEVRQGKSLIDISKDYNISHFVYSSVIGADLHTGIPHWESKYEIEEYLKQAEINYTILRPASLFENFLIPPVRKSILKGKLVSPVNYDKVQQFISSDDIGRIVASIFQRPADYTRKTLSVAFEQMDFRQVTDLFSECLHSNIKFQRLPGFIVRLAMGKNLYKMFTWINNNNAVFVHDLDSMKKEYPGYTTLKQWITQHFMVR